MSNLLRAEFYKLSHSWYFWGIGLFNLFLSSLLLLDSNGKTPNLFFASLYNTPLLYFLMIVFAVLFAGNDFEQKTMYLSISAGHKRSSVILAKTIVYETACAAILFFPLFIHGLPSCFTKHFLQRLTVYLLQWLPFCFPHWQCACYHYSFLLSFVI